MRPVTDVVVTGCSLLSCTSATSVPASLEAFAQENASLKRLFGSLRLGTMGYEVMCRGDLGKLEDGLRGPVCFQEWRGAVRRGW